MTIPGSNLLNLASTVIALPTVIYVRNTGRSEPNAIGNYVPTYAAPQNIKASVQAVNRSRYEYLGLDFQKNYSLLYTSTNIIDLGRDVSGDLIAYNGRILQCESEADWFAMDGWTAVLCIDVGVYPPARGSAFSSAFNPLAFS